MSGERILVVDDEKIIQKSIQAAFKSENMQVTIASSGKEALSILNQNKFDLILLDILMPDMDGFEVVQTIRNRQIHTPIIFLSGKAEEYNKVLGLGFGADDYITKPFSVALLISKSKALIRRTNFYSLPTEDLNVGPFSFNHKTFRAYKFDKELLMTAKELSLFKFFLQNPNQVFTKEQLYHNIWNETAIHDNTIMVYIKRIRGKIEEDPKNPKYIKTVWGIGYQLDC